MQENADEPLKRPDVLLAIPNGSFCHRTTFPTSASVSLHARERISIRTCVLCIQAQAENPRIPCGQKILKWIYIILCKCYLFCALYACNCSISKSMCVCVKKTTAVSVWTCVSFVWQMDTGSALSLVENRSRIPSDLITMVTFDPEVTRTQRTSCIHSAFQRWNKPLQENPNMNNIVSFKIHSQRSHKTYISHALLYGSNRITNRRAQSKNIPKMVVGAPSFSTDRNVWICSSPRAGLWQSKYTVKQVYQSHNKPTNPSETTVPRERIPGVWWFRKGGRFRVIAWCVT